ncbi:hypothetical protein Pmani_024234 [Petrolisthes manimaculis]|uniref:Uncharacterized protein n=1 Tax=Petrolisthes manimaculis TaxID=1843537 RepID=A0AAE1P8M8_9EUCA|nr:hypothetical protein Pmani_024234 [Petrolisthes manimaculis]
MKVTFVLTFVVVVVGVSKALKINRTIRDITTTTTEVPTDSPNVLVNAKVETTLPQSNQRDLSNQPDLPSLPNLPNLPELPKLPELPYLFTRYSTVWSTLSTDATTWRACVSYTDEDIDRIVRPFTKSVTQPSATASNQPFHLSASSQYTFGVQQTPQSLSQTPSILSSATIAPSFSSSSPTLPSQHSDQLTTSQSSQVEENISATPAIQVTTDNHPNPTPTQSNEEDSEDQEVEARGLVGDSFQLQAPAEAWEKMIAPRLITFQTRTVYSTTYTNTVTSQRTIIGTVNEMGLHLDNTEYCSI